MISNLKTECGHQYTSKLEGMFKDIAQSQEINESYHQIFNDILNTKVLTTGFWPIPRKEQPKLPLILQKECENFKTFYCDSHSGRKLLFDTSRGTAEL